MYDFCFTFLFWPLLPDYFYAHYSLERTYLNFNQDMRLKLSFILFILVLKTSSNFGKVFMHDIGTGRFIGW